MSERKKLFPRNTPSLLYNEPTYIRNHMHFYLEKFGLFRSMCVAVLSLRECSKGGEYVQGGVVVRGAGGGGDVVAAGGGAHGAAPANC